MSLYGSSDAATNTSVHFAQQVKVTANTDNRDALFGNVTPDAFISGATIGVFGVDSTEIGVGDGGVAQMIITDTGSGYNANATVTVSGAGTANAQVNSTGRVATVHITGAGDGYTTAPSVTIAAPAAQSFNALTAVSNTAETITLSDAGTWQVDDAATYAVASGNTAVGGLEDGTTYYVSFANSTVIALAASPGGANINLTASVSETGHTLTGETATATAVIGGGSNMGVAHTGFVLRTVGSGGRAGRVHNEVLVAGGIGTDASDDTILPDS